MTPAPRWLECLRLQRCIYLPQLYRRPLFYPKNTRHGEEEFKIEETTKGHRLLVYKAPSYDGA